MKRFLVFYGDRYYPCGGMEDFIGDFDSSDEALSFLLDKNSSEERGWHHTWGYIYDTLVGRVMWESPNE